MNQRKNTRKGKEIINEITGKNLRDVKTKTETAYHLPSMINKNVNIFGFTSMKIQNTKTKGFILNMFRVS